MPITVNAQKLVSAIGKLTDAPNKNINTILIEVNKSKAMFTEKTDLVSNFLLATSATPIPISLEPILIMPNHTTVDKPPSLGSPIESIK